MTRRLLLLLAAPAAVAAIAAPLAVQARDGDDPAAASRASVPASEDRAPDAQPSTEPPGAGDAGPFAGFPLDLGWAATYGRGSIDGPGPGSGGISMPEGHCREGVLFESGHQDKLSTHVGTEEVSHTRELLGYDSADAARATLRALRDAVASCAAFDDAYTGEVVYTAHTFGPIDESRARAGSETFTFAYTSSGSPEPFGVLYQFAVVDDVLYGSSQYGDWTPETVGDAALTLDRENAALVARLGLL